MLRRRALNRFGGRIKVLVVGHNATAVNLVEGMERATDLYEVVGVIGGTTEEEPPG